ncbi:DUF5615 family PIN-like protein [Microbacterium halotolerans]|uniref:DUF5615 family PIN-like protein n=1 Tax=Microbacterium halotolerans TaxID=246613 RepID=UPI000E6AAE0C|nr:DUF5615 family PIN-like protein [Microbacterium halotolerans]
MSEPGRRALALLLDEHYPERTAGALRERGIDAQAVVSRADLVGRSDSAVLRAAADERRAVVTEDVTTFSIAMASAADHTGIIFCHHARFPRTPKGLRALEAALLRFAFEPPLGLVGEPFVWWLSD